MAGLLRLKLAFLDRTYDNWYNVSKYNVTIDLKKKTAYHIKTKSNTIQYMSTSSSSVAFARVVRVFSVWV